MTNDEIKQQLNMLSTAYCELGSRIDRDLIKVVQKELPDKIKIEILNSVGLEALVEKAIEKSQVVLEMQKLSKINHDLKKAKGELESEIKSLKRQINELKYENEKQHIELYERANRTSQLVLAQGQGFELLTKIAKSKNQGDEKPEKPTEPIYVRKTEIENQGELIYNRPSDFKRKAFRESISRFGISKRKLTELLGVSVNTPDRIKGRIQDYIAEKHPDKPIYVKIRLVKYGNNHEDVVLYFPHERVFGLFGIPSKVTEPWETEVRQAILGGTAILKD